MRTKLKGLFTLLLALAVQWSFAQEKKVTGKVTDASSGEPLPGVNIVIEGTQKGTVTDFDGNYSITASPDDVLVFSYVGYKDAKEKVGNRSIINVQLTKGTTLQPIVVDISGKPISQKVLSYADQKVNSSQLQISDIPNVQSQLNGKVAGVQVWEQAGSKLGFAPKVRIRGRINLNSDANPLYVVDGVVVSDPSSINPDDIESVEVLKGPNATQIYGQIGENGVIKIITKKAKSGNVNISLSSKVTFEKIAYLPKYQNDYGQGYLGENEWMTFSGVGLGWQEWNDPRFNNANYIFLTFVDESWGPKFDGRDYMPWYAWYPDSPYFGKTAKWEAQPDNVKNFYDTGVFIKNNIALSLGTKAIKARFSFSNLDQKGTIPFSTYKRYFVNSNVEAQFSKAFKMGFVVNYSKYKRHGDFDDQYGNQTSGSFNAWFARQLDMKKQKELIDLKSPEGYLASWNWWGPYFISNAGSYLNDAYKKAAFWFNHYTWLDRYDRNGKGTNILANIWANFKLNDNYSIKFSVSRDQRFTYNDFHLPYEIQFSSAPEKYTSWVNSFGIANGNYNQDTYDGFFNFSYPELTDNLSLDGFLGTTFRTTTSEFTSTWMPAESKIQGLINPDIYKFENTKCPVPTNRSKSINKVVSFFGKATLGISKMLYLEASARQEYNSGFFPDNNGFFYPSVGLSWTFTDLNSIKDNEKFSKILPYGKFRIGWAQIGSSIAPHIIYPTYRYGSQIPYFGHSTILTPSYSVDQNLHPALNSSFETGLDLEFLKDKNGTGRIGLNITYYYEKRKDEIIFLSVPSSTGKVSYLTNGGTSHRSGVEFTLNGNIISKKDFQWVSILNFNKNKSIIDDVPGESDEMYAPGGRSWSGGDTWSRIALVHKEGKEWGQLKGYDILRDENGNPVLNPNGFYIKSEQVYFGSVLPDFTGGWTNEFTYKNFKLAAHITFQKGGKFFSGSEVWGYYSGLYEETANGGDREAGVSVEGVDSNGNKVSYTVDTQAYYEQFHEKDLAGPFIHDASYLKLREVSLTYTVPKKVLGKYLKGASVGIIGTNLWLIAVAKDNYHRWDPSELSQAYGEDAQLPGTRRFGLNLNLQF